MMNSRRQLHLAYYGIGEARMADVPGRGFKNMPFFVGNKFEIEEEGQLSARLGNTFSSL